MELIYCFSIYLLKDKNSLDNILKIFERSVQYNKRFHPISIFTDKKSLSYLKDFNVNINLFNFKKFRFLDDIKLQILPLLNNNQILIDIDIFLYKRLDIQNKKDIVVEKVQSINKPWYVEELNLAKDYMFINYLDVEKNTEIGNIGILKINNKKLLEEYIEKYNKVTESAKLESIPPFPRFSILFGQLLLQNIIDKNNYSQEVCENNKKNSYLHLGGSDKYNNTLRILKRYAPYPPVEITAI